MSEMNESGDVPDYGADEVADWALEPSGPTVLGARVGLVVCVVGGLLAIAQAMVGWQVMSTVGFSVDATGADFPGGKIMMGLGAAVLVLATAWALHARFPAPALIATIGLVLLWMGVVFYFDQVNQVADFNQMQQAYRSIGAGGFSAVVGPGAYMAVACGVLTTAGGVIGLVVERRKPLLTDSSRPGSAAPGSAH
jgi:xanthosine utilization system XapX-like protein